MAYKLSKTGPIEQPCLDSLIMFIASGPMPSMITLPDIAVWKKILRYSAKLKDVCLFVV